MKLTRWQKYKKKHPKRAALHNKKRLSRTDRRTPTIWHRRLRALLLHCGLLGRAESRPKAYAHVEVRLTVHELARVWFRDGAWGMETPELDRVDPKGHYELSNVRFVEREINQRRTFEDVPF